MKVLHVSRTMGQGGAEKIVYQLCHDNTKFEQAVISCGGVYVKELEKIGIRHYEMPDIDKKNPYVMLKCFLVLRSVIKKEHIDILHAHHRMAAFYGRIVSFFIGTKCVYTAHNAIENKKWLMRFSLKKSGIVAVGDEVRQNLINYYGISQERIKVIYNSVKVEKTGETNGFLSEKKIFGNILIGNIGRLTEQKGMDVFIYAIKKVVNKHPNVVGVIIGDGEERVRLEKLTKELGMTNHITFLGYQKNILNLMGQLDFVVLSSRGEGLPLTPIETFSQGKTIIASDVTGSREVVANGINGLTFQKDDTYQLADKIVKLIEDKKLLKQLEKGALETYQKKYDYKKFIKEYQNVYKNSIS